MPTFNFPPVCADGEHVDRHHVPGKTEWTARERVVLWLAIAVNDDWVPDAHVLLANLRAVIVAEECQPDPLDSEWSIPHAP